MWIGLSRVKEFQDSLLKIKMEFQEFQIKMAAKIMASMMSSMRMIIHINCTVSEPCSKKTTSTVLRGGKRKGLAYCSTSRSR